MLRLNLRFAIRIKRKKEIGIRKVLGSSVKGIVILLNVSLTKPILISLLTGMPLGFIIMNKWLEDFAYKIEIGFVPILGSGFSCLIISWLVISYLTYSAARTNPTENLRYE